MSPARVIGAELKFIAEGPSLLLSYDLMCQKGELRMIVKPKKSKQKHQAFVGGIMIAGEGPCFLCTHYTRCVVHSTLKNVLKEVRQ